MKIMTESKLNRNREVAQCLGFSLMERLLESHDPTRSG